MERRRDINSGAMDMPHNFSAQPDKGISALCRSVLDVRRCFTKPTILQGFMSITGSPNSDFRTQEHASGWAMYRPKRKFFRGFIKRRASLLILFLAFSFVLSLFYNLFFKPQYISSATVDLSGIFKDGESELAKINFFASRLKSEQFIETVLISHNLGNENNHKPFVITGEKIEAYRNSLRVSPLQETAFISIDVISESPELSKKNCECPCKDLR